MDANAITGDPTRPTGPDDTELLAVVCARELRGRNVVFSGHGLPTLAVALAQRTVSPDIQVVFESGVIGAHSPRLALSISDSILVTGAEAVLGMTQLFGYVLQGGRVDVAFLGAAQIDRFGNLNSTLIGTDWSAPTVRLPGSGGAIEAMANAHEVFVVMRRHTPQTLVETVDFCTSPSRRRVALGADGVRPTGLGVTRVVTSLAVFEAAPDSGELVVSALQPGVELATVQRCTGWSVRASPTLHEIPPPTETELTILRDQVDPARRYLR